MTPSKQHDDYADRLIDQALEEKAGGKTPPDLSRQIATASRPKASPPPVELTTAASPEKSHLGYIVTAALLFGGIVIALVATGPQNRTASSDAPRDGDLLAQFLSDLDKSRSESLAEATIDDAAGRDDVFSFFVGMSRGMPAPESYAPDGATHLEDLDGGGVADTIEPGFVEPFSSEADVDVLVEYSADSDVGPTDIEFGQSHPFAGWVTGGYSLDPRPLPRADHDLRFSSGGTNAVNGIPLSDLEPQRPLVTSVVPAIQGGRESGRDIRYWEQARERARTLGRPLGVSIDSEGVLASNEIDKLKDEIADARAAIRSNGEDRDAKIERMKALAGKLLELETQTLAETQKITPPVKGRVTAMQRGFVELSLGADDGLREGQVVEVERDDTYLGVVVVRRTTADRAVGELIPQLRRGEIARGDRVVIARLALQEPDELPADEVAIQQPPAVEPPPEEEPAPEPKKTWRRAKAVPNASRLVIGDEDELLPEGVQMSVRVDGFRARVLMDLFYYNDRGRQLEGNFKLRLPDEASLFYFAFGEMSFEYRPQDGDLASGFITPDLIAQAGASPADIARLRDQSWENVKEARLVPRVKAAHAYSETVRRKIDPALVEWSGAGVFNARVFPLADQKLHRIVVGYDVNLTRDGGDLLYQLDLPPDMASAVIDLNVAESAVEECVLTPPMPKHVRPLTTGGRTNFHYENPTESISLRMKVPGTLLITGGDESTGVYFATDFPADLPAAEIRSPASHAVFLVDTSLSSRPEKFNTYLALMESMLNENRDTMRHFSVLLFNIESHWWRESFVENTPENVQQLIDDCHTLALEGATDLRAAFTAAASPAWLDKTDAPPVEFFLLSDGAATWGETNLHRVTGALTKDGKLQGTLFAYKTGQTGTATGVLEHLARESGGAVFSVTGEDEVRQAAQAHRQRPWQLLGVEVEGGSDLLIAGRPKAIYPGQPLRLVGRGTPKPDAEVLLKLQRGEEKKTLTVSFAQRIKSELTPRMYGQVAVGQLEDLQHAAEDVAVSYARHFRVTGQACSLLMLESEEDYERFHIKAEEDPFVVKSRPTAALVRKTLAEIGDRLDDPKASLLHFLKQLEEFPGLQFKMPKSLAIAIEQMPAASFELAAPPLECRRYTRDDIPQAVLDNLNSGELDYDLLTEESQRRLAKHGPADALKTLSSLIENNPGDVVLARDVAFSALEWKLPGQAVPLLQRVARMRPYEPQTYQALGKSLTAMGKVDQAMVYYEVLLAGGWPERYGTMRQVAGVEYLDLLQRIAAGELATTVPDFAKARRETLAKEVDLVGSDLIVTMMWNTDRTDVDLHVIEPSNETCYYQQMTTANGGQLTFDVTEGFGPEMYFNKAAPAGEYRVLANFYGGDANRTSARTKVFVTLYRDFGSPAQQATTHVIPLSREQEMHEIVRVKLQGE